MPVSAARLAAVVLVLGIGCAAPGASGPRGAGPPRGLAPEDARAALVRFAGDVESGRWADAHALLSARWRDVYTPGRLALDYRGAGPVGREAAQRVAARLGAGAAVRVEGARAVLPVGADRAAVLVAEDGGWRVDALE